MALGDGIRRNIAHVSKAERDRFVAVILKLDKNRFFPDGFDLYGTLSDDRIPACQVQVVRFSRSMFGHDSRPRPARPFGFFGGVDSHRRAQANASSPPLEL
jgi:hypothetical protein